MQILSRYDLTRIASIARIQFQDRVIDCGRLSELYSEYASIPDYTKFVLCARAWFPRLNCGLAAVYLRSILPGARIVRGAYRNRPHTFIVLPGRVRTVVDVTADQYGGPPVYVGPVADPWKLSAPGRPTYPSCSSAQRHTGLGSAASLFRRGQRSPAPRIRRSATSDLPRRARHAGSVADLTPCLMSSLNENRTADRSCGDVLSVRSLRLGPSVVVAGYDRCIAR